MSIDDPMYAALRSDLAEVLNRHSLEGVIGNTPDFVMAEYLIQCLIGLKVANRMRDGYHGIDLKRPFKSDGNVINLTKE